MIKVDKMSNKKYDMSKTVAKFIKDSKTKTKKYKLKQNLCKFDP